MWSIKPNKSQAYHLSPLGQFSFIKYKHLIPSRLELETYLYQRYTLPIKLRNLLQFNYDKSTQI